MFLWNYETEFATQILDNIFQISLHIWAVSLLFHLLRPVYHNQLIYNLSLINVHTLFMELKGQNSFHCPIYIKHVIFHSVIFLLSFRNMAINLSYLLASQIQLHVLLENKYFKLISCILHSKKKKSFHKLCAVIVRTNMIMFLRTVTPVIFICLIKFISFYLILIKFAFHYW